jgi:site-specific recombinase XerD
MLDRLLASIFLDDAYTDFILSRQAMLCKPTTLRFYRFTAGKFVEWLKANSVNAPDEIAARHVRAYLAELDGNGLSDSYIHGHARAIRTLIRFLHKEKYIPELITFEMPSIDKKRLLVLSADDLQRVIKVCHTPRDKAVILLIADSGIRRAEVCALTQLGRCGHSYRTGAHCQR